MLPATHLLSDDPPLDPAAAPHRADGAARLVDYKDAVCPPSSVSLSFCLSVSVSVGLSEGKRKDK